MITDCLSGANIFRDAVSATGGRGRGGGWEGRGAPQQVGFLHRFGLKTGIHFGHFGPESGMVFEGTTGVYVDKTRQDNVLFGVLYSPMYIDFIQII